MQRNLVPAVQSLRASYVQSLPVWVYRAANGIDCTNGGTSSQHETMRLFSEHDVDPGLDDERAQDVLVLVEHRTGLRAVAYQLWAKQRWVMFGGNFIYSSDSRFPSKAPIKIFDRFEDSA